MIVYKVTEQYDSVYAIFHDVREWVKVGPRKENCSVCGNPRDVCKLPPLRIEWQPGYSEPLGDFVWCFGGSGTLVPKPVFAFLNGICPNIEAGPVFLSKSSRRNRKKKGKGASVDEGPKKLTDLVELRISEFVLIDEGRSTIVVERYCEACGARRNSVEGIEFVTSRYDPETSKLRKIHHRRRPGCGLYVDAGQADRAGMFRVEVMPWWILCTDKVRAAIEARHLTNIDFLEVGEGV